MGTLYLRDGVVINTLETVEEIDSKIGSSNASYLPFINFTMVVSDMAKSVTEKRVNVRVMVNQISYWH